MKNLFLFIAIVFVAIFARAEEMSFYEQMHPLEYQWDKATNLTHDLERQLYPNSYLDRKESEDDKSAQETRENLDTKRIDRASDQISDFEADYRRDKNLRGCEEGDQVCRAIVFQRPEWCPTENKEILHSCIQKLFEYGRPAAKRAPLPMPTDDALAH